MSCKFIAISLLSIGLAGPALARRRPGVRMPMGGFRWRRSLADRGVRAPVPPAPGRLALGLSAAVQRAPGLSARGRREPGLSEPIPAPPAARPAMAASISTAAEARSIPAGSIPTCNRHRVAPGEARTPARLARHARNEDEAIIRLPS